MRNKGKTCETDRLQNFGGNRRAQVNNVNYIEGFEVGRNTAPDSSSFQTLPTFTLDQYNHLWSSLVRSLHHMRLLLTWQVYTTIYLLHSMLVLLQVMMHSLELWTLGPLIIWSIAWIYYLIQPMFLQILVMYIYHMAKPLLLLTLVLSQFLTTMK